jgi:hypothetical protein
MRYLDSLAEHHGTGAPRAILEMAAGPARHAREWARRGVAATALDLSSAMCEYALACAACDGVALHVVVADLVDFSIGKQFDLAVMPMDSSSYLLDNAAALNHLDCVARHLVDGGLYVLEMTHPRTVFGVGTSTGTDWVCEGEGLRVHTCWGDPADAFDPITQVDEVTVTMTWSGPAGQGVIHARARQKRFTSSEVDALVRANGQFEIVQWLGSLAKGTTFSNEPAAAFMVPVLRKKPGLRCWTRPAARRSVEGHDPLPSADPGRRRRAVLAGTRPAGPFLRYRGRATANRDAGAACLHLGREVAIGNKPKRLANMYEQLEAR